MRITRNISHSATSVLELFKFVTSLGLVSAVSVSLGVIMPTGATTQLPELYRAAILVAFILLLVRYYHGNSLHLLECYEEGVFSRNPRIALPADAFFILIEGILLTSMSFAILDARLFYYLLSALVAVDVVWSGLLLAINKDPT